MSTNSGSENSQNHSKTSSSDNLHASPGLRNTNNQTKLSGTPRHSLNDTNNRNATQHKSISEGSISPHGHSTYSVNTADVYGDNQTVINLGMVHKQNKM